MRSAPDFVEKLIYDVISFDKNRAFSQFDSLFGPKL